MCRSLPVAALRLTVIPAEPVWRTMPDRSASLPQIDPVAVQPLERYHQPGQRMTLLGHLPPPTWE